MRLRKAVSLPGYLHVLPWHTGRAHSSVLQQQGPLEQARAAANLCYE